MKINRRIVQFTLCAAVFVQAVVADSSSDAGLGPDLPPIGSSLFDKLFSKTQNGSVVYDIPYPFDAVIARFRGQLESPMQGKEVNDPQLDAKIKTIYIKALPVVKKLKSDFSEMRKSLTVGKQPDEDNFRDPTDPTIRSLKEFDQVVLNPLKQLVTSESRSSAVSPEYLKYRGKLLEIVKDINSELHGSKVTTEKIVNSDQILDLLLHLAETMLGRLPGDIRRDEAKFVSEAMNRYSPKHRFLRDRGSLTKEKPDGNCEIQYDVKSLLKKVYDLGQRNAKVEFMESYGKEPAFSFVADLFVNRWSNGAHNYSELPLTSFERKFDQQIGRIDTNSKDFPPRRMTQIYDKLMAEMESLVTLEKQLTHDCKIKIEEAYQSLTPKESSDEFKVVNDRIFSWITAKMDRLSGESEFATLWRIRQRETFATRARDINDEAVEDLRRKLISINDFFHLFSVTRLSGFRGLKALAKMDQSMSTIKPILSRLEVPPETRGTSDEGSTRLLSRMRNLKSTDQLIDFLRSDLTERKSEALADLESLFPFGRSLQRPRQDQNFNPFQFPREVVRTSDKMPEPYLARLGRMKDRIFCGYLEPTKSMECISYNDDLGRFEFQVIQNYGDGLTPKVHYASRAKCISCHLNQAPIFPRVNWLESDDNVINQSAILFSNFAGSKSELKARQAEVEDALNDRLENIRLHRTHSSTSGALDFSLVKAGRYDRSVLRANQLLELQDLWRTYCGQGPKGNRCRAGLFKEKLLGSAFEHKLSGFLQTILKSELLEPARKLFPIYSFAQQATVKPNGEFQEQSVGSIKPREGEVMAIIIGHDPFGWMTTVIPYLVDNFPTGTRLRPSPFLTDRDPIAIAIGKGQISVGQVASCIDQKCSLKTIDDLVNPEVIAGIRLQTQRLNRFDNPRFNRTESVDLDPDTVLRSIDESISRIFDDKDLEILVDEANLKLSFGKTQSPGDWSLLTAHVALETDGENLNFKGARFIGAGFAVDSAQMPCELRGKNLTCKLQNSERGLDRQTAILNANLSHQWAQPQAESKLGYTRSQSVTVACYPLIASHRFFDGTLGFTSIARDASADFFKDSKDVDEIEIKIVCASFALDKFMQIIDRLAAKPDGVFGPRPLHRERIMGSILDALGSSRAQEFRQIIQRPTPEKILEPGGPGVQGLSPSGALGLFVTECARCHGVGPKSGLSMPQFIHAESEVDLVSNLYSMRKEIVHQLQGRSMPPGGGITEDQRTQMINYVRGLK